MTTSPTLTSSGTRLPLSSTRPGPTATTVPSCGFSLAVSGMTRPEAVVVSASLAWTTTRSSSGLMLTLVAVVTSATPPSGSDGWWVLLCCCGTVQVPAVAGVRRPCPCRLALYLRECQPLNRAPEGGEAPVRHAVLRARRRARAAPLAAHARGGGGHRARRRAGGPGPRRAARAGPAAGAGRCGTRRPGLGAGTAARAGAAGVRRRRRRPLPHRRHPRAGRPARSEEHTSELQSRQYLVCRLLLEKK